MRLILLLIVLAAIGLLVARQLQGPATPQPAADAEARQGLPRVPQNPQGVQQFGQDMNRYVQDAAKQQEQKIDEGTR